MEETIAFARHDLGAMNFECEFCGACFWETEKLSTSTTNNFKFGICCMHNKVKLPPFPQPPLILRKLLIEQTEEAKLFRTYIRSYNSALAFASLGADINEKVSGKGVYTFKIQGAMYHRMGPLCPTDGVQPKFAQIYFFDTENELQNRLNVANKLNKGTLSKLQNMMHLFNPLYHQFKTVLESSNPQIETEIQLIIRADKGYSKIPD
jgi:hypothetical protein